MEMFLSDVGKTKGSFYFFSERIGLVADLLHINDLREACA